MLSNPHERRESVVEARDDDLEHVHYHDPARILRREGPRSTLPQWYISSCCCCCFSGDTAADLESLLWPGGGSPVAEDVGYTAAITNTQAIRMRRAARCALLIVAFFLSVAQWSAIASGVELFTALVGLSQGNAAAATSGMFALCFFASLAAGIFSDYRLGSPRVLTIGLLASLTTSAAISAIICPYYYSGGGSGSNHPLGIRVCIFALLLLLAVAVGLCQAAVPALIGDQCVGDDGAIARDYVLFYAAIQAGAFIARIAFPQTHHSIDWFVAAVCFLVLPTAIALIVFSTHTNTLCYKIPNKESSVALKATAAVIRRNVMRTPYDVLAAVYGWDLVEAAVRAAAVLRVHAPLPIFWALYFQMFELWFMQASDMDLHIAGTEIGAEQTTVLNPLFDVCWLLLFSLGGRLVRSCRGIEISPHTKIFWGYVLATVAFSYATALQFYIASRDRRSVSVLFQIPQYAVMAAAEVLLYPSSLHVVYVDSPVSMRGFIQSCLWFFIGLGNLVDMVVLLASTTIRNSHVDDKDKGAVQDNRRAIAPLFIVYAALMAVATALYLVLAWRSGHIFTGDDDDSDSGNGFFRRRRDNNSDTTFRTIEVSTTTRQVVTDSAPIPAHAQSEPEGRGPAASDINIASSDNLPLHDGVTGFSYSDDPSNAIHYHTGADAAPASTPQNSLQPHQHLHHPQAHLRRPVSPSGSVVYHSSRKSNLRRSSNNFFVGSNTTSTSGAHNLQ